MTFILCYISSRLGIYFLSSSFWPPQQQGIINHLQDKSTGGGGWDMQLAGLMSILSFFGDVVETRCPLRGWMWLCHRRTVLVGARRVSPPYRRLVRQRGACAGLPRTGGHNGHRHARNPECVSALYNTCCVCCCPRTGLNYSFQAAMPHLETSWLVPSAPSWASR